MSTRTFVLLAVLIVAVIVLFFPLTLGVAPAWTIQVVDQNSRPVEGCNVQESWTYSFIEHQFHESTATTNAEGMAVFPAQTIPASLFRRWSGRLSSKYAFHSAPARPVIFATACVHQPNLSMSGQIDFHAGSQPTRVAVTRR